MSILKTRLRAVVTPAKVSGVSSVKKSLQNFLEMLSPLLCPTVTMLSYSTTLNFKIYLS
jgi:hypothetical protein